MTSAVSLPFSPRSARTWSTRSRTRWRDSGTLSPLRRSNPAKSNLLSTKGGPSVGSSNTLLGYPARSLFTPTRVVPLANSERSPFFQSRTRPTSARSLANRAASFSWRAVAAASFAACTSAGVRAANAALRARPLAPDSQAAKRSMARSSPLFRLPACLEFRPLRPATKPLYVPARTPISMRYCCKYSLRSCCTSASTAAFWASVSATDVPSSRWLVRKVSKAARSPFARVVP
ncbi:hypothetical protein DETS111669_32530 [Delftia tsuruhatensis]